MIGRSVFVGGGWVQSRVCRVHVRSTLQTGVPPSAVPTLCTDFPRADKVALVAHQDDRCVGLGLPEEEAELRSTVETPPVRHREDQDAHITLQSGQVLGMQTYTHTCINKTHSIVFHI